VVLRLGRGRDCTTRYRSLATFIGSNRRRRCGLSGHTCLKGDGARNRRHGGGFMGRARVVASRGAANIPMIGENKVKVYFRSPPVHGSLELQRSTILSRRRSTTLKRRSSPPSSSLSEALHPQAAKLSTLQRRSSPPFSGEALHPQAAKLSTLQQARHPQAAKLSTLQRRSSPPFSGEALHPQAAKLSTLQQARHPPAVKLSTLKRRSSPPFSSEALHPQAAQLFTLKQALHPQATLSFRPDPTESASAVCNRRECGYFKECSRISCGFSLASFHAVSSTSG
jgi:hypothetical protein